MSLPRSRVGLLVRTDDERPAKTQPANREAFIQIMRAPLHRLEDLRVARGQPRRALALYPDSQSVSACHTVGNTRARTLRLRWRPFLSVYVSYSGSEGWYCSRFRSKSFLPALMARVDMITREVGENCEV